MGARTAARGSSPTRRHLIGVLEVVGALGLLVPGLTGIRPHLTWTAAAGLAIIMAGAVASTVATMGVLPAAFPLAVGMLDVSVMFGRRPRRAPASAAGV